MISFRTVSGRRIDLEHLRPEDVRVEDIACALARCCRFAGHVRQHYSVAQHCLLVYMLAPFRLGLESLIHDASEAYLGDLSRHLKHSKYLVGYRVLEERVTEVIERHFGLRPTPEDREAIKAADDVAACFEHVVLRRQEPFTDAVLRELLAEGFVKHQTYADLAPLVARLPPTIPAMTCEEVERTFLDTVRAESRA